MTKEMKDSLVQMITAEVLRQIKQQDTQNALPVASTKAGIDVLPETMLTDTIITARKLEGLSVVSVGAECLITPSANDYIKEKKIQLQRASTRANTASESDSRTYHFWSACSKVKSFDHRNCPEITVKFMHNQPRIDEIDSVLGKIDSAIKKGSSIGGIVVVETSPRALFATRKFSSLRPIVGNYSRSIEDGVDQIGANLLVLETAYLGKTAVLQLAELFVSLERVTGFVTLTVRDQNLPDGKLLICEVLDRQALEGLATDTGRSTPMAESLVAYDDLGAGEGSLVALSESGEATAPFRPKLVPLDAYCSAILDKIDLEV